MPLASDVLDALLRLGDQIAAAVEADEWDRVSRLVEERSELVQQLSSVEGGRVQSGLSRTEEKKLDALTEQNDRLTNMLRERRDELEEEIVQVENLRHAQDSYDSTTDGEGVLPSELSG